MAEMFVLEMSRAARAITHVNGETLSLKSLKALPGLEMTGAGAVTRRLPSEVTDSRCGGGRTL